MDDSQFVQPLNETVHDILIVHQAILRKVAEIVGQDPQRRRAVSLYSILQNKLAGGVLSYDPLAAIAASACKEIDYFGLYVGNLEASLRRTEILELYVRPVDICSLLTEIADLFGAIAEERQIELDLQVPDNLLIVADPGLLFRAIANIVDNAIKYSFATSKGADRRFVEIRAKRHDSEGGTLIHTNSFGVGVKPDEIKSVFNYGVRGEFARDRERRGSGIGLSETKRIVESHGGSVTLDSVPKGSNVFKTTVELFLPREPKPNSRGVVAHEYR